MLGLEWSRPNQGPQDKDCGSDRSGHWPKSLSKCPAAGTTRANPWRPGDPWGDGAHLHRPFLPRLLEADSKSMRSMNGSRRNSGSSLVSSSSASSNLSHLEEDTWILWGRIANEWEEWRRKKEKLIKVAGAAGGLHSRGTTRLRHQQRPGL